MPDESHLASIGGWARQIARAPNATRELLQRARARASSRGDARRLFLRHLGFLGRDADVIHFEFLGLGALYPLAGPLVRAPVIVSCRGQDVHLLAIRSPAEIEPHIRCLREADAIHCVSAELANAVEHLTGRTDHVWVNRPAVDTEMIRERAAQREPGPFRIIASGRLVWVKGFDYLLRALAQLRARDVDFRAEIVGEGELFSQLRYTISDLGLDGWVSLVGGVPSAEVLARLARADAFVLSSHEEGISNGVLEAMAVGLPIVTTRAGGMAEALDDGIEGFLVPVRNVELLADRLERLARDPSARVVMGHRARLRAVAEFSIARQIDTFEQLYERARELRR
jgi:glycosyltransferase involved in cell wall biosynthesis